MEMTIHPEDLKVGDKLTVAGITREVENLDSFYSVVRVFFFDGTSATFFATDLVTIDRERKDGLPTEQNSVIENVSTRSSDYYDYAVLRNGYWYAYSHDSGITCKLHPSIIVDWDDGVV